MDAPASGQTGTPKKRARQRKHKRAFLAAFRVNGNVSRSADAAGVSRSRHYEWLDDDDDYKRAFADAEDEAGDKLEAEARRRAIEGVEEPVFGSMGNGLGSGQVGTVVKYSDTLLIFLLKGARPEKYAERHNVKGSVKHTHSLEEIIAGKKGEEQK